VQNQYGQVIRCIILVILNGVHNICTNYDGSWFMSVLIDLAGRHCNPLHWYLHSSTCACRIIFLWISTRQINLSTDPSGSVFTGGNWWPVVLYHDYSWWQKISVCRNLLPKKVAALWKHQVQRCSNVVRRCSCSRNMKNSNSVRASGQLCNAAAMQSELCNSNWHKKTTYIALECSDGSWCDA